jgi:hypothetical protein
MSPYFYRYLFNGCLAKMAANVCIDVIRCYPKIKIRKNCY